MLVAWLIESTTALPRPPTDVLLIALVGGFGSIASILIRLHDFRDPPVRYRTNEFFVGAFKPVVGMGFAIFVTAAFISGLIPLRYNPVADSAFGIENPGRQFLVSLAFLSGFSERWVRDVISRVNVAA
jgi:hypothetical protein